MADVVPGVIADVAVKVISVDTVAGTATIRVIDNNGVFLPGLGLVPLPIGLVRVTQFPIILGDVLEEVSADQQTAVVRWVGDAGQTWSESPTGVPAHSTIGWRKIGNFPLPA